MEPDDKVCLCFHVSKRKIQNFIRIQRPSVASQISECGGAGTGCGWCVPFLKKYFAAAKSGSFDDVDEITLEEYARGRGEYVEAGRGTPPAGATPVPSRDTGELHEESG